MPRKVTQQWIIDRLREGYDPAMIPSAMRLGSGCFRTGYRIGQWVVKHDPDTVGCFHLTRSEAIRLSRLKAVQAVWPKDLGFAPTRYIQVKGDRYVIQPYLRRLTDVQSRRVWDARRVIEQMGVPLDIDDHNTGRDRHGRLLAFDW